MEIFEATTHVTRATDAFIGSEFSAQIIQRKVRKIKRQKKYADSHHRLDKLQEDE